MADETQRIFNLLQNSTKAIANYDVWKYFLKTAAWHFKYPFNDQVLIFFRLSVRFFKFKPFCKPFGVTFLFENTLHIIPFKTRSLIIR